MEREKFLAILRELRDVCEYTNKEDEESKVIYEVLQFSELSKKWNSVHNIANFYNHNWLGNVDFMHIPDFEQTLRNCQNYPIIIAREKGTDTILGISTIKYDENSEQNIDPYFPEPDTKYFSVTGILVKKNNPYKGIGKKIYEIAIRGAYNYEKSYPGTKMTCVIDCRNKQSLRALASAINNIETNNYIGEGKELPAHILGYYELRGKENDDLLEAPTLVMEIDLRGKSKSKDESTDVLEYTRNDGEELFNSLLAILKDNFSKYGINEPIIEEDTDCGMVYFYSLQEKERCKIENVEIKPHDTAEGNDRKVMYDRKMHEFIGPMPSISVEEER